MRAIVAPSEAIFLDAKFESELVEMEEDEAREFLAEMGVEEPGLDVLARVGYDTLGLQSYLTAGPKEARGWTIKKGATAPEAAGVIHTDFQKGFIKAEVVSFDDLVATGSEAAAKAAGKMRLDGEYGQPDEMLSARAWRMRHTHPKLHVWIDRLWFWDANHCRECWEIERARKQLPQTYEFDI